MMPDSTMSLGSLGSPRFVIAFGSFGSFGSPAKPASPDVLALSFIHF
jgi:hypothetical protein